MVVRLKGIAYAWEGSWPIKSNRLVKTANRLWRISTLTIVQVGVCVEIRIHSRSKLHVDSCPDAHCPMLLLLGLEVTMMIVVLCQQVYLMNLGIVSVALSIAVWLPSTCEIQELHICLTNFLIVVIGEQGWESWLIQVIFLNMIDHKIPIFILHLDNLCMVQKVIIWK